MKQRRKERERKNYVDYLLKMEMKLIVGTSFILNERQTTACIQHNCLSRTRSYHGGPGSTPGQVCGICGGKGSNGAGFVPVLRFSLPLNPPTTQHQSFIHG
jgi:hypothetical protein